MNLDILLAIWISCGTTASLAIFLLGLGAEKPKWEVLTVSLVAFLAGPLATAALLLISLKYRRYLK